MPKRPRLSRHRSPTGVPGESRHSPVEIVSAMRVGLISDTHNRFDPGVVTIFAGVDHILHAGDVGLPAIMQQLEAIAPVTIVGGNTDDPGWGYPDTALVVLDGIRFLVHHIVDPGHPSAVVRRALVQHRPDAVVYGHTHQSSQQTIGGIRYLNPGSAGQSRFHLPRTVMVLTLSGGGIDLGLHVLGL